MILYTNGCSNTYGHCNDSIHSTWPHIVLKSLVYPNSISVFSSMNTKQSIVPNFDDIKNDVLLNEAMTGGGNDYIFHSTIESLSKLLNYGLKPDYVIIQWSGTNRKIHIKENGEEILIQPTQYPEYEIKWEPVGSKHTIHYVYMLQEFLKKYNINYLFFNYMEWDKSVKKLNVFSEIDMNRWVDFGAGNDILFKGIKDYMVAKGLSCDDAGHPNLNGSYFIANQILNKLGVNTLPLSNFYKKLT